MEAVESPNSNKKIYEAMLMFREAVIIKGGEVVRIALDKEGYGALAKELTVPLADKLFGVTIEKVVCPTCGK